MSKVENPLALAAGLTAKANQLCIGLEDGVADIYDLVTPTTAELLRWWFLADICATRPFNFHAGQRQAILNAIVAHEVPQEAGDYIRTGPIFFETRPATIIRSDWRGLARISSIPKRLIS